MDPHDFRAALERLGFTQNGFAKFTDSGERTVRRWAIDGAPRAIGMLLAVMQAHGLSAAEVERLLDG